MLIGWLTAGAASAPGGVQTLTDLFGPGVYGVVEVVETNATTDPAAFAGPYDTYQLVVFNGVGDITAADAVLPGTYLNTSLAAGLAPVTFSEQAATPEAFGNAVPETFFVLPPGGLSSLLAIAVVDTNASLQAAYALPPTNPISPFGESVFAFFATPAGAAPDASQFVVQLGSAELPTLVDLTPVVELGDIGVGFLGDATADGRIAADDLDAMASNFGLSPPGPRPADAGDFDANGLVDLGDLDLLATNFGREFVIDSPPASAAPEPATAGLLALALLTATARCRIDRAGVAETLEIRGVPNDPQIFQRVF